MLQSEPTILARPRRMTRDEYHRLIALGFYDREKLELIHGILVRMSPVGIAHRRVIDRLSRLLMQRLGERAQVSVQQPFLAWDDSEPEPDISLVALEERERHPDHAYLLVEVADTSLDYDRLTKGPLYAASSVEEYWIVNLVERVVEVHREPADGRWGNVTRHRPGATVSPLRFPDVEVVVEELLK